MSPAKPDLVEAHPGPDEHREGARTDLGVERSAVARRNPVELDPPPSVIRAGEKIEPAGRGFRIRHGLDVLGKGKAFGKRNDVDAALLEDGTGPEVDPVRSRNPPVARRPGGHGPARNEARTPVGDGAEAKIYRGGLDLGGVDRGVRRQGAGGDKRPYLAVWQSPGHRRIRLRYRDWSG